MFFVPSIVMDGSDGGLRVYPDGSTSPLAQKKCTPLACPSSCSYSFLCFFFFLLTIGLSPGREPNCPRHTPRFSCSRAIRKQDSSEATTGPPSNVQSSSACVAPSHPAGASRAQRKNPVGRPLTDGRRRVRQRHPSPLQPPRFPRPGGFRKSHAGPIITPTSSTHSPTAATSAGSTDVSSRLCKDLAQAADATGRPT